MTLTGKLLLSAAALVAFSGSAMAADLYIAPNSSYAPAPSTTNWDGPYIGASVGYAWGTAQATSTSSGYTTGTSGWLVGAQAGYNFHLSDAIVAGIEGNIDWANETGSLPGLGSYTVNWDGSIRGRLGLALDTVMPYVEAGVAFANATAAGGSTSFSGTHTGWTVGAGLEVMLADQLSANVEYRYSNYGNTSYNNVPIGLTDSQLRVGLNYHF